MEEALISQRDLLRLRRDRAAVGTQASARAATAWETWTDTMAVLEQYGEPELQAMVKRVRWG